MNFSTLIFEGRIFDIVITEQIDETQSLEVIIEQNGDSPGLYGFYVEDMFFEIIVFNTKVVGIQYDFQYEVKEPNVFNIGNESIIIDNKTTLNVLKAFFEKVNVKFEIVPSTIDSIMIVLENFNARFYFDNEDQKLFKLIKK